MTGVITGATLVAGVVGAPVRHSLSPLIHNAWIAAAGLDAVYVPFSPPAGGFARFGDGLRGGAIRGLNVTLPFKGDALDAADKPNARASIAGAANLLLFEADGSVRADNTDGEGLLAAFKEQAPGFDPGRAPVVILGAGGAARGAAAAFVAAGAPEVRLVNRTLGKAEAVAAGVGGAAQAFSLTSVRDAFNGAGAVINATSVGLDDDAILDLPLEVLPSGAVAMDMVYAPLVTGFLAAARLRGLATVDGLAMLVGQARPSFAALFGQPPPEHVDVRGLALAALGNQ